jgi:hypothetical protein
MLNLSWIGWFYLIEICRIADLMGKNTVSQEEYDDKFIFIERLLFDLVEEKKLIRLIIDKKHYYIHSDVYRQLYRNEKIDELLAGSKM